MVTSNWGTGRFLEDKESRQKLVDLMPQALRDEYLGYKFVGKEAAFPGRVFVVYTLSRGQPTNLDIVTLGHLIVNTMVGPVAHATSEGQGNYPIGIVPSKWRGRDVFLQVPQEFIFKWKGKETEQGVEFAPHYALLVKTRSRVDEQIELHSYCETLNDFRARFPGVPIRY